MHANAADNGQKSRVLQALGGFLQPSILFPSLFMGIIIWTIDIIIGAAFSAFIFHGRLAAYAASGLIIFIISALALSLLTALFSKDASVIPSPQDTTAVIFGAMAATMVAQAPADMADETLFTTLVATMVLSSILTGLSFIAIGTLRIANLIRYIPHPVFGGFLAGTGWLLVRGAFAVMIDLEIRADTFLQLFHSDVLVRWLPAPIMAITLLILLRRSKNILVLPAVVILALVIVGGAQRLGLASGDPSLSGHWFVLNSDENIQFSPLNLESFAKIDVPLVLSQAASIAALILFSTLNLLLNISGQELVVGRELEFNRELTVAGFGNVLGSLLGGGFAGFPALAYAALVHRTGSNGRIVNLVMALGMLVALALGVSAFVLFPKAVLGGVLMYLGLSFLVDWLYDAWSKMPRQDYLIVVAILLVIAAFGILWGIAIGIMIAMALFVLEYSQIVVIRQEFGGNMYRSNTDRSHTENRLLRQLGDRIMIFRLQGYIFFGTGFQFYQQIRKRIVARKPGELLFIILDFRLAHRLDISTVVDFTKLRQLAETRGIHVMIANASPEIRAVLLNSGFMPQNSGSPSIFDDLDHAMEWCENELLAQGNLDNVSHVPIAEHFDKHAMIRRLDIDTLSKYLERIDAKAGEIIANQGEEADTLFLIESGKVDILLSTEHNKVVRLRRMSAGSVVGEVGFYLGHVRSATIVVTESGVFQRLSRSALHQMEEDDPQAAIAFHIFTSCVLSERLTNTNRMIEALID